MQSNRQPITVIVAGVYSIQGLTKPTYNMDTVKEIRDDFKRFVRHTAQRYNYRQDQIVDLIEDLCNPTKF